MQSGQTPNSDQPDPVVGNYDVLDDLFDFATLVVTEYQGEAVRMIASSILSAYLMETNKLVDYSRIDIIEKDEEWMEILLRQWHGQMIVRFKEACPDIKIE